MSANNIHRCLKRRSLLLFSSVWNRTPFVSKMTEIHAGNLPPLSLAAASALHWEHKALYIEYKEQGTIELPICGKKKKWQDSSFYECLSVPLCLLSPNILSLLPLSSSLHLSSPARMMTIALLKMNWIWLCRIWLHNGRTEHYNYYSGFWSSTLLGELGFPVLFLFPYFFLCLSALPTWYFSQPPSFSSLSHAMQLTTVHYCCLLK